MTMRFHTTPNLTAALLAGTLLWSAPVWSASVPAKAVNDEIRFNLENSASMTIGRIRLENVKSGDVDNNRKNYDGLRDESRRVKLKVRSGGSVTDNYRLYFDPVGGLGNNSGEILCANFAVTSSGGKITALKAKGPSDLKGVKERQWTSTKSKPQIVTVNLKVEGYLGENHCKVDHIRRRAND